MSMANVTGEDPITLTILNAAKKHICRKGLEEFTMAAIAQDAGVSKPALYARFADTDAIALAVQAAELRGLLDRLAQTQMASMPNTLNEIVRLIVIYTDELRRSEVFSALSARNPEILTSYLFTRLGPTQLGLVEYVATFVRRVQDHDPDNVKQDEAHQLAAMVVSLAQSAALQSPAFIPLLGGEDLWRKHTAYIMEGYLGVPRSQR
ncbi:TetR/AcrR family transcriptional regulator [Corynebacterium aquilae]|uniref:HTH tetR-type domain-containing protein n=1 Tax=Corynebacterium aquilae DSM 44791 TaxID=1431546 RepID=A0A1L7CEK6_9CORY|nr:TetR/AcrR family transcriptional regulator [Corynebacterium aquilae]APT84281.1 hypothetical protein CAQU_03455 [Corynebacterium aquilae DSM 44791]